MRTAEASKELLAPRADVWAFVSEAGRLADWWPGVFAAQDHGEVWTIEGEERAGLDRVADRGDHERTETVQVAKSGPGSLHLRFERSGYDVQLSLAETTSARTTATLTIAVVDRNETFAERLEELAGLALWGPGDGFAESIVDRLYDVCQTGAGD